MLRMSHGSAVYLEDVKAAVDIVDGVVNDSKFPLNVAVRRPLSKLGYMFPGLQNDPAALLPESSAEVIAETVANLKRLGATMSDRGEAPDSSIPSLYTYFGQFVAHDISFEAASREIVRLNEANLRPLSKEKVEESIRNLRTATLDLDCVYGDECNRMMLPRDKKDVELFELKYVSSRDFLPANRTDIFQDVPRAGYAPQDRKRDRAALIGDPRNDENVVNSQLHVAFLRAHNAIVRTRQQTFNQARTTLRQHYQWVVFDDYLKRVADPKVVAEVIADPRPQYDPREQEFFLPLEFSAAAFRFGHTMVRASYAYNHVLNPANLVTMFDPLMGGWESLQGAWVIEWENFADGGRNAARRIDTQMVEPLSFLFDEDRQIMKDEARLAVRNLLRGYILRLPTGQAVARALGLTPLTAAQLLDAAANQEQRDVLSESGFLEATPLWFYILAETAHARAQAEAQDERADYLGPVGSRIVAEVLVGLLRRSEDSILRWPGWTPTLPKAGERFKLSDLLRLAEVMN